VKVQSALDQGEAKICVTYTLPSLPFEMPMPVLTYSRERIFFLCPGLFIQALTAESLKRDAVLDLKMFSPHARYFKP